MFIGGLTTADTEAALAAGCQPVSFGTTRLRTETAGVVGAALLCV
ncbi:MAG: 16S rRNA (uracil(1498)-N(3))-methyltransferase [Lacibacter sp.]